MRESETLNELTALLAWHVGETGESESAVEVLRRVLGDHEPHCPNRARVQPTEDQTP